MKFDHVAINVADIARSIAWYKTNLNAEVLYEDATWGFVRVGGVKLALTLRDQHPGHIAFDVGSKPTEEFFKGAKTHRDGSISKYVSDPDGNSVEWIHYPDGSS